MRRYMRDSSPYFWKTLSMSAGLVFISREVEVEVKVEEEGTDLTDPDWGVKADAMLAWHANRARRREACLKEAIVIVYTIAVSS